MRPTLDASLGSGFHCLFCHERRPRAGVVDVLGAAMCKRCCVNQANRRQAAFLIEQVVGGVLFWVWVVFWAALMFSLAAAPAPGNPPSVAFVVVFYLGVLVPLLVSPLRRDCGWMGALGKRLCGVRAVDRDTLEPVSASASLKRNLVLFLPLAKLLIGGSLGTRVLRCGDGWANSVVLRSADLEHPVFHGARTCGVCFGVYDPEDPAGCGCVAPQRGALAA